MNMRVHSQDVFGEIQMNHVENQGGIEEFLP